MRKQVFGRKFKRDTNERKALFKGLASSLVMHERIETTEEKAKAIKGHVEKMVTKVNTNDSVQAKKLIEAYLTNDALAKMMSDIAPRFTKRPGGYTRILKTRKRFSDDASMAIIEWVEKAQVVTKGAKASATSKKTTIDEVLAVTAPIKSKKASAKTADKKAPVKKTATKTAAKKKESK